MEHKTVVEVMKEIRVQYDEVELPSWGPDTCNIYFEENQYKGKGYNMPLITLKTKPCKWLLNGGGCTSCNYNFVSALYHQVTSENLINQAKNALEKVPPSRYPFVTLTSAGSFMSQYEIDDETRFKILRMFSEAGVEHLNFESRAEFLVDPKRLAKLHDAFSGTLSVGIGLESSNDFVRRFCINKGLALQTFLKGIEALKESDISFDVYVLVGKPFLSPHEDIEDAVTTINFAFDHGAEWVILMVANLQPYTLSYWMHQHKLYQLPKLWSPLAVLEALSEEKRKKVLLKGIDRALPTPKRFASNCEKCTQRVVDAHIQWNLTGDYEVLSRINNGCGCKEEWLNSLDDGFQMQERVEKYYDFISSEILNNTTEEILDERCVR